MKKLKYHCLTIFIIINIVKMECFLCSGRSIDVCHCCSIWKVPFGDRIPHDIIQKYRGPRHEKIIGAINENSKINFFVCPDCKLVIKSDNIDTEFKNVCDRCSTGSDKSCPKCMTSLMKPNSGIFATCGECNTTICWICAETIHSKREAHDKHSQRRYNNYINNCILIANRIINIDYVDCHLWTRELLLLAIRNNALGQIHLDKIFSSEIYKNLCHVIVSEGELGLHRVNRTLFTETEYHKICIAAVERDYKNLKYIQNSKYNKKNKCFDYYYDKEKYFKLCKLAVNRSGHAIQFVIFDGLDNTDKYMKLCEIAILKNPDAFIHVKFFSIRSGNYKSCLSEQQYKRICLIAVGNQGLVLNHVIKEYLNDDSYRYVCIQAIQNTYHALQYVKIKDSEIYDIALKIDGAALKYINIQTPEMCLNAVKSNGLALEFSLHKNEEICSAAVQNNPNALKFVKNQTEEICLAAVQKNGMTLNFVKNKTKKICYAAVRNNSNAINYVPFVYKLHCHFVAKIDK